MQKIFVPNKQKNPRETNNMKKIFCVILLALSLSSCNDEGEKNVIIKSTNFSITEGTSKTYKNRAAANTSDGELASDNKTNTERAQIICKAVTKMEGIDKAAVIISGNAAIVGITTSDELTDQKLTKLKKDVEEKVMLTDKSVRITAVTAAADLVERITELSIMNTTIPEDRLDTHNILNQIPSSD